MGLEDGSSPHSEQGPLLNGAVSDDGSVPWTIAIVHTRDDEWDKDSRQSYGVAASWRQ